MQFRHWHASAHSELKKENGKYSERIVYPLVQHHMGQEWITELNVQILFLSSIPPGSTLEHNATSISLLIWGWQQCLYSSTYAQTPCKHYTLCVIVIQYVVWETALIPLAVWVVTHVFPLKLRLHTQTPAALLWDCSTLLTHLCSEHCSTGMLGHMKTNFLPGAHERAVCSLLTSPCHGISATA